MSTAPAPYLVLGIGNLLLRDEGVGVHVIDGGTAGADLVDLIAGRRKVVIVDAVDAGVPPGTILRLRASDLLPADGGMMSLHQLGLVESLGMAAQLGCEAEETLIVGIQPREISPGLELSDDLAAAMPAAVRAVLAELPCVREQSDPQTGGEAL